MAVNLSKGQVVSINDQMCLLGIPSLRNAAVALGWDCNRRGSSMDLDAWALAANVQGQIVTKKEIVYFGNKRGLNGCIVHSGDNLTGAGDGDDETIYMDLDNIPMEYNSILVGVTIYRGKQKRQSFGDVRNAFIRLYDRTTGIELFRYADGFNRELSRCISMFFGVFYREFGVWKFKALGRGNDAERISSIPNILGLAGMAAMLLPLSMQSNGNIDNSNYVNGYVDNSQSYTENTNNQENSQGGKKVMAVNLSKGAKVSLAKVAADAGMPGLTKVVIGLGWDTNRYDGGHAFDLDAAAFMQGANNKVRSEEDFIFYNHKMGPGIEHTGDNRTGEGDGDDEQIKIDLAQIPADVQRISFTVTIDQAVERGQSFGMVENSYVRVLDEVTGTELIRYDLGEDYSVETAVVVAELYRHNGEWKFNAVGSGFQGGLAALCGNFGINIE